LKSIL